MGLRDHRLFLTGVPGVGKTSVAKLVASQSKSSRIEVVNFGEIMSSIALRSFNSRPISGASLAPLKDEERAQLQVQAAELIASRSAPLIVDGHLVVDTGTHFVPGLPMELWAMLDLVAIVVLTADVADVLFRRGQNLEHRSEQKERINEHERLIVLAAREVGVTTYNIRNDAGRIQAAVAEVSAIALRHLQG